MVVASSDLIAESVAKFADKVTAKLTALKAEVVQKGEVEKDGIEDVGFDLSLERVQWCIGFREGFEV